MTEAFNGLVTGQEKPKMKLPETATPGNSPARGATSSTRTTMVQKTPTTTTTSSSSSYGMKHSDSSFGLHSPDSLNDDVQVRQRIKIFLKSFLTRKVFVLKSAKLSLNCPYIGELSRRGKFNI